MERFAINPGRQRIVTGLAAALRKLAIAGCTRVIRGSYRIHPKTCKIALKGAFYRGIFDPKQPKY
jgi:hypothetical protein